MQTLIKDFSLISSLIFFVVSFGQSQQLSAKLEVVGLDSVCEGPTPCVDRNEVNVKMAATLYVNGVPVDPQPTYLYRWWRRNPNVPGQAYYLRDNSTGYNRAGTHVYQDSTDATAGMFDYYCIIKGYGGDTNNVVVSDTIRIPWWSVRVAQQMVAGNSYGTVRYWKANQFTSHHAAPDTFLIPRYAPKVLLADTTLTPDRLEKYHNWTTLTTTSLNNHKVLVPGAIFDHHTSQFGNTRSATIRTFLLDTGDTTGGFIDFSDPWYRDSSDQFGILNRGFDAVFRSKPSPFTPNTNTSGSGSEYQGVFLNQDPQQGLPWYELRLLKSRSIAGASATFLGWESVGVGLSEYEENPLDSVRALVIFNAADALVTAKYKWHLGSSSSAVTAPTMQRKVVRDSLGAYHMVYESAGEIWYTRSTNSGTTWSPETRIAQSSSYYRNRTPSLTVQTEYHTIVVVWERYATDGSDHYLYARTIDPQSGSISQPQAIWQSSSGAASINPVVASGIGSSTAPVASFTLAVWYDAATQAMKAAVRRASTGEWLTAKTLRTGNISNITLAPIANIPSERWRLIWREGYNLRYAPIYVNADPVLETTPDSIVAYGAAEIEILSPSAANLHISTGCPAVCWEEYNDETVKRVIKYRERPNTGTWGVTKVFTEVAASPDYRTPSVAGHYGSSNVLIAWRKAASQLKYVKRVNGTWSAQTNLATGVDPNSSVGWTNPQQERVLWRGTSSPYAIGQTSISLGSGQGPLAGKEGALDPMTSSAEGRGGRVIFPGGMVSLVVLQARLDTIPIAFTAINDTTSIRTLDEFAAALSTESFVGRGTLTLQLLYSGSGSLPRNGSFSLAVKDAHTKKTLAVARRFTGIRDTILTINVPLNYANRTLELRLQPQGFEGNLTFEVERWFISDEPEGPQSPVAAASQPAGGRESQQLPTTYLLEQNYPNPFNPATAIRFQLPADTHVLLKLYDVLGQEVSTLVDEAKSAGYYEATLDASTLASGLYFYRMVAGDFVAVKKLLLTK